MSRTRLTCDTSEVAHLLGVERHCLGRMADEGTIPESRRFGRRRVWLKAPLADFLGVSLDDLNTALAQRTTTP